MPLVSKLRTLDKNVDDEARRAISKILQNSDSSAWPHVAQEVGPPSDSRYSELFEIEYGKEDSKMQTKQLFEALSNRNDRKPILLRPGWDTLCATLKGKVETRAGATHLLRDASLADHEWLLSQIDVEIVNEETFSAIFKVVIMWRIVRTIEGMKVSNSLQNHLLRWFTSCVSLRAPEEPIAISVFSVWVDLEGIGTAFNMLWGDNADTMGSCSSLSSAASIAHAASIIYQSSTSACVDNYRSMESERPEVNSEADALVATARRSVKPFKKLLPRKKVAQGRKVETKVLDIRASDLSGSAGIYISV